MNLNLEEEGGKLLDIFKTWYENDRDTYSEYYLISSLMIEHLYGSIDNKHKNQNQEQMRAEIDKETNKTQKNWTLAVYGPFLQSHDMDATTTNADRSLVNALSNKGSKSIAYLTHGAQYTLWYGMKSNKLGEKEQRQFGLPEGTTHAQAYEQILCTVSLLPLIGNVPSEFPSNSTTTTTMLEKVDLYIEVLLTCRQMRQKANRTVLRKWYKGIIDMNTMQNNTFWECKGKIACKILKQRCHIKMILWYLLARLESEDSEPNPAVSTIPSTTTIPPAVSTIPSTTTIPPAAPSAPISVRIKALQYLKDTCAVPEFVCLPEVGVQQLDVLDTLLKAAEADPLDATDFLKAATTYVNRDESTWVFQYNGIRMEIAEGEKQHLLYRFAQAKNTNKVIYALVPLFARIFRVYDDKEACQKRCGYTNQCEFNNDASIKLFNQYNYGKGTQTLEQVLQQCKANKDTITGFNCISGVCQPSSDSNPRFSKADYGNLATAHQQCIKYCEGTAGYTCFGERKECTEVQEDAAFPFKNYNSHEAAREACNKESDDCMEQQSPFDFDEITNITGKECGQETKGVGKYENFYFPWPQAKSNNLSNTQGMGMIYQLSKPQDFLQTYFNRDLAALKGFVMNHGAGSGKTVTAQAIVSNFLDSNHRDGRDAWHVLWVTKSSLKEQPLKDFYLHPSGFLKRAILTPTPSDVQRWMRRMSKKQDDAWIYQDEKGKVVSMPRDSVNYLPLNESGQYDKRKDTRGKQIIRFRICMHAYLDSNHRKRFAKNFNLLGKDVEQISAANPQPRVNKAITYQAFVDLLNKKNNDEINTISGKMWQMGGQDPLRKTLVVVDEAHNLVSNSKHYNTVLKYFHNSFQVSKDNSCKVVLMTATPITTHPIQAIHLLHLVQEDRTRWLGVKPLQMSQTRQINVPHYTKEDFVDAGPMTLQRKMEFLRLMGNDKMSYFAGELDPRLFALKLWGDISQVDNSIIPVEKNGIVQSSLSTRMVESMQQSIQSLTKTSDIQQVMLNLSMSLHQTRGNQRNRHPNKLSVDEVGLVKDPDAVPQVNKTSWMKALLTRFNKIEVPEAETETDEEELDD